MKVSNGEHFSNLREGYVYLARTILHHGEEVRPRGYLTRELLDWSFVLEDPTDTLPIGTGRGLSLPFAAVEAAQLIAGVSSPSLLTRINPTMQTFLSERELNTGHKVTYQHGAYGPRVGPYLERLVSKLKSDSDTRQALVTVWSPRSDYADEPDIPCTLSLHFMIRNDKLVLMTTMRSNDIWWGTAYDCFQFTQLQLTVANVLGLESGPYHHRANSMHIYERDFEKVDSLTEGKEPYLGHPVGFSGETMGSAQVRAHSTVNAGLDGRVVNLFKMTESEKWYSEQLLYVSPRAE